MRKHLKNIVGIITAFFTQVFGILFGLWQLDLIVSGPVWWEASPTGMGWAWYGPGAYQRAYFQCFLWKTTVGMAYDVLFTIIFLSAVLPSILLFISIWYWED